MVAESISKFVEVLKAWGQFGRFNEMLGGDKQEKYS